MRAVVIAGSGKGRVRVGLRFPVLGGRNRGQQRPVFIRDRRRNDRAKGEGHHLGEGGGAGLGRAQHHRHLSPARPARQVQVAGGGVLLVILAGLQHRVGLGNDHRAVGHHALKLIRRPAARCPAIGANKYVGLPRHTAERGEVHAALVVRRVEHRILLKLRDLCGGRNGQPRQRPCTESQQEVRKSFHKWIAA